MVSGSTSKLGKRYEDSNAEYVAVGNMFRSSLRAAKEGENADLLEEWKYLVKHMERHRGLICFWKNIVGIPHVNARPWVSLRQRFQSCQVVKNGYFLQSHWIQTTQNAI